MGHQTRPVRPHPLRTMLTARETEVLERVSHGLTNRQVASELDVSPHVVKFHLASVYRKLSVANRTQAAAYYLNASHGDFGRFGAFG